MEVSAGLENACQPEAWFLASNGEIACGMLTWSITGVIRICSSSLASFARRRFFSRLGGGAAIAECILDSFHCIVAVWVREKVAIELLAKVR